jgi:hypothetical protein
MEELTPEQSAIKNARLTMCADACPETSGRLAEEKIRHAVYEAIGLAKLDKALADRDDSSAKRRQWLANQACKKALRALTEAKWPTALAATGDIDRTKCGGRFFARPSLTHDRQSCR